MKTSNLYPHENSNSLVHSSKFFCKTLDLCSMQPQHLVNVLKEINYELCIRVCKFPSVILLFSPSFLSNPPLGFAVDFQLPQMPCLVDALGVSGVQEAILYLWVFLHSEFSLVPFVQKLSTSFKQMCGFFFLCFFCQMYFIHFYIIYLILCIWFLFLYIRWGCWSTKT